MEQTHSLLFNALQYLRNKCSSDVRTQSNFPSAQIHGGNAPSQYYQLASVEDEEKQPLMGDSCGHIEMGDSDSCLEGYNSKHEGNESYESLMDIKAKNDFCVNMYLAFLFILSSLVQLYIGLKCISFEYSNEIHQGTLIGFQVLWVNVMTWALRELVNMSAEVDGDVVTALHPHGLTLHIAVAAQVCDVCGRHCKEGHAYRCKLCNFDICTPCMQKASIDNRENLLRGDKVLIYM